MASTALKRISTAGVPAALAKAERYRLLNEPDQAESICRDILAVDDNHHAARITLLLAMTDQFSATSTGAVKNAEDVLARVTDAYLHAYYDGIIHERWAVALLAGGDPGRQAYVWLDGAMQRFAKAETLAETGNDDAILRWNSCARRIARERLAPPDDSHVFDHGDSAPQPRERYCNLTGPTEKQSTARGTINARHEQPTHG